MKRTMRGPCVRDNSRGTCWPLGYELLPGRKKFVNGGGALETAGTEVRIYFHHTARGRSGGLGEL